MSVLEAYQWRIYKNTSENEKFRELSKFTEKLTQNFPTLKIDLFTTPLLSDGSFLESEKFLNNGPIIYIHDQNFDQLSNQVVHFLDLYDKSYPKYTMPKCLIVYEKALNISSDGIIKKILQHAWSKKFLDITVFEVAKEENRVYFYTFNPFLKKLYKYSLSHRSTIFPNKLSNLENYPLSFIPYHNPPYMIIVKDLRGKHKILSAYKYKFLKMVLKQMNFLEVFHESIIDNNPRDNFIFIKKKLSNQEVNISGSPTFAINGYSSLPLLILHDDCVPYVGIIEIEPIIQLNVSTEFIFYFIYIPLSFFCLKFIIFLLKLKTIDVDFLEVVRLLLGMSLLSFPKFFWKRIVVILISFITMMFSIDFIASILNTLVSYDELTFNSVKEIIESDYKIIMNKLVQNIVLSSEEDQTVVDIFKAKSKCFLSQF